MPSDIPAWIRGAGNDVLNGGTGYDQADYYSAASAIVVDLSKGKTTATAMVIRSSVSKIFVACSMTVLLPGAPTAITFTV